MRRDTVRRRTLAVLACWLACWSAAGCGLSVPTDPDGTLDRVRATGTLRAGASPGAGLVDVSAATPTGPEVALVEGFADSLGAEVTWSVGGEEHLVDLLERGRLDVAVGGISDRSPWSSKVSLTRPYRGRQVMMVPMGENALQSALERWLDTHAAEVLG